MADRKIPLDVADKILFAESLVNYVLRDNDVHIETILDYNYYGHDAFSMGVKMAIDSIKLLLSKGVEGIFRIMEEEDIVNEEIFSGYGIFLRMNCFPQGFKVESFLKYSVHIAMLASKFPPTEISDVAVAAFSLIMACYEDYEMVRSGRWDMLEQVAKEYYMDSSDESSPSSEKNDDSPHNPAE